MLIKPVVALFVDPKGPYPKIAGVDYWDEKRDARLYTGPYPCVAHPPCHLWVNLAAVNWKRYKRQKPAWYEGGSDGNCFFSAYMSVMRFGGVLEHPAYTHAWERHGIVPPNLQGWSRETNWHHSYASPFPYYYVCEVYQSVYDNPCQKRTWLFYCGKRPPFELDWSKQPGTHQIGWFDRNKPTVGKREASLSPMRFAETLVALARWSRG